MVSTGASFNGSTVGKLGRDLYLTSGNTFYRDSLWYFLHGNLLNTAFNTPSDLDNTDELQTTKLRTNWLAARRENPNLRLYAHAGEMCVFSIATGSFGENHAGFHDYFRKMYYTARQAHDLLYNHPWLLDAIVDYSGGLTLRAVLAAAGVVVGNVATNVLITSLATLTVTAITVAATAYITAAAVSALIGTICPIFGLITGIVSNYVITIAIRAAVAAITEAITDITADIARITYSAGAIVGHILDNMRISPTGAVILASDPLICTYSALAVGFFPNRTDTRLFTWYNTPYLGIPRGIPHGLLFSDDATVRSLYAWIGSCPMRFITARIFGDENQIVGIEIVGITGLELAHISIENFNIPAYINGIPVTRIGAGAFQGITQLESVTIPYRVNFIGANAFNGATNLTTATIPSNSHLLSIGQSAFANTNISSITIPARVYTIQPNAFANVGDEFRIRWYYNPRLVGNCWLSIMFRIDEFVIPANIESIREYIRFNIGNFARQFEVEYGNAFFASHDGILFNSSLTTVYRAPIGTDHFAMPNIELPNTVTHINSGAFAGVSSQITIPASVTSIGTEAFFMAGNVVLAHGWTSIPNGLFAGTSVSNLYIPPTVTSIGTNAFNNPVATTVRLTQDWTYVPSGLFNGNSLESFVLNEGLLTIGTNAFANMQRVVNLDIPSSVVIIGEAAFYNNRNLANIMFAANSRLTTIGDRAFANNFSLYTTMVNWQGGIRYALTLPHGVSAIGYRAFAGTAFRTVNIPAGVTHLGNYAFAGDINIAGRYSRLRNVVFAPNSSLSTIGDGVFYRTDLRSVTLPASVVSVGDRAFEANISLTSIRILGLYSQGAIVLGDRAFYNTNLFRIVVPSYSCVQSYIIANNWSQFASYITFNFVATEGLAFSFNGSGYTVSMGAAEIDGTLYIPSSHNGMPVTRIAENGFADIATLERVYLQDQSMREIGAGAFANATSLVSFTITPFVNRVGYQAFYNNSSLSLRWYYSPELDSSEFVEYLDYVTIPSFVTRIADYAFKNAVRLQNIVVPHLVESIGARAFAGATNLTMVDIQRPMSLGMVSLGDNAFYGADSLNRIYVPCYNSMTAYASSANWQSLERLLANADFDFIFVDDTRFEVVWNNSADDFLGVYLYFTMPSIAPDPSARYVIYRYPAEGVFALGSSINSFDLGRIPTSSSTGTITMHLTFRFANQANITHTVTPYLAHQYVFVNDLHTNIIRHERHLRSITAGIRGAQFIGGSFILANNIYLQQAWTPIWSNGFMGVFDGNNHVIVENNGVELARDRLFSVGDSYRIINFGTSPNLNIVGGVLMSYSGTGDTIRIPSYVIRIADRAFNNNWRLRYVRFAEGSQLTHIGYRAFAYNDNIRIFDMPDTVEFIGARAFQSNHNLRHLTLPATLTHVGASAFSRNYSLSITWYYNPLLTSANFRDFLTHVVVPYNVTEITTRAFDTARRLESVEFMGNNVRTIGNRAFQRTGLTHLTLPQGLTTIGEWVFYDSALESVKLPNTVTRIEARAFNSIGNLTAIIVPSSVTFVGGYAFSNNPQMTVYICATAQTQNWYRSWAASNIRYVRI